MPHTERQSFYSIFPQNTSVEKRAHRCCHYTTRRSQRSAAGAARAPAAAPQQRPRALRLLPGRRTVRQPLAETPSPPAPTKASPETGAAAPCAKAPLALPKTSTVHTPVLMLMRLTRLTSSVAVPYHIWKAGPTSLISESGAARYHAHDSEPTWAHHARAGTFRGYRPLAPCRRGLQQRIGAR